MKNKDLKSIIQSNLQYRYPDKLPETPIFIHRAKSENCKAVLLQLLRDSDYDIEQFSALTCIQIKEYRGDRLDTKREVLSSEISSCIEQIETFRSEEYSHSYLRLFFDDYEGDLENLMLRVNLGDIYQVLERGEDMQSEYNSFSKIDVDLLQDGNCIGKLVINIQDILIDVQSWELAHPCVEKELFKSVQGLTLKFRLHIFLSQDERIRKLENSLNLAQEEYELLNEAEKLYYELLEALEIKSMAGEYISLLELEREHKNFSRLRQRSQTKGEKDCDYCCQLF
jgi:hypothetical protein